jgi:hypothetical protein
MINEKQADQILNADFANLIKKVKSGKTLSASERARVEAARDGNEDDELPARVTNKSELARILKTSRQVLNSWRKLPGFPGPGSDGSYIVADCIRWKRENKPVADDDSGVSKKDQLLAVKISLLELELFKRRRELIPSVEVKRSVTQAVFGFKRKLLAIPKRVSQILAAESDAISIEERLNEEIYDALESLSRGEWVEQQEA